MKQNIDLPTTTAFLALSETTAALEVLLEPDVDFESGFAFLVTICFADLNAFIPDSLTPEFSRLESSF